VASRLYIKRVLPGPGHVTCSHAITVGMAMMQMRMRRNKHHKPLMDQRRMCRTEDIVLESLKMRLYISDM